MASLDDMVSQLPMDQIAQALGVDEATAAAATKKAIPALVQGMQANATSDPAKAAALAKAIAAHAQQAAAASATAAAGAATGTAGAIDISKVDTADGEKIVGHVFGDNTEQVTNQLGGLVGGDGGADLFKKLLPMLAPLVMGFLAKNLGGGGGGGGSGSGGGGGGGARWAAQQDHVDVRRRLEVGDRLDHRGERVGRPRWPARRPARRRRRRHRRCARWPARRREQVAAGRCRRGHLVTQVLESGSSPILWAVAAKEP